MKKLSLYDESYVRPIIWLFGVIVSFFIIRVISKYYNIQGCEALI